MQSSVSVCIFFYFLPGTNVSCLELLSVRYPRLLGFASLVGWEFVKVGHRLPPTPGKTAEHTALAGYPSCLFSIVSAEFLSAAGHFQLRVWVLLELPPHLPGWWPDLHPIILPGPFPRSILRGLQFLMTSYFYHPFGSQAKWGRREINGHEADFKKIRNCKCMCWNSAV